MSNWIIPSNSKKFDLAKFLLKHGNFVDWKQSANFEVGDVIYIYCTKPEMRIRYKMEVVKTNIPFNKSLKDENCWMTQNLDLDLESTASNVVALTSENTDLNQYDTDNTKYYNTGYTRDNNTGVIT